MTTSQGRYNLSKLISFVGNDKDALEEMVHVFIKSANELLAELLEAQEQNEFEQMFKAAHRIKPSLEIMGLDDLYHPVREIEMHAKSAVPTEQLSELIAWFDQRLRFYITQLEQDFSQ